MENNYLFPLSLEEFAKMSHRSVSRFRRLAIPANWKQGEDCVLLPSVSKEEAEQLFPKGFTELKPYLRLTPQV